ncbi:MAG: FmdB family zinc ribbon protein [Steroidobacteraceae bacterium]
MPFYEYECPACKFYLEVLQKLSDKPLKKCPSCGKAGFRRLVSAPVFRLKGSGWYETDFKSDKEGQRNLAGAEREEAAPADAKAKSEDKTAAPEGDAKAGSKPEAKPDSKPDKDTSSSRSAKRAAKPSTKSSTKSSTKPVARRGAKRATRTAKRGKGRR